MIQKVLKIVRRLCELLTDDLGQTRHVGMVVPLQRLQLPQRTVHRVRLHRVRLVGIKRVVHAALLQLLRFLIRSHLPVQHECARWMCFQHVVHPRHYGHHSRRGGVQGKSSEPLDEAGDHCGGEMRRGHEDVEQAEEATTVLRVQHVGVKKRVQLRVKVQVVEVLLLHEVEETRERQQRGGAAGVEGVGEEIHQQFDFWEPRDDAVRHQVEQGLLLGLVER